MTESKHFKWQVTKVIRAVVKGLILYPVMIVTALPTGLYLFCQQVKTHLESWWWE